MLRGKQRSQRLHHIPLIAAEALLLWPGGALSGSAHAKAAGWQAAHSGRSPTLAGHLKQRLALALARAPATDQPRQSDVAALAAKQCCQRVIAPTVRVGHQPGRWAVRLAAATCAAPGGSACPAATAMRGAVFTALTAATARTLAAVL